MHNLYARSPAARHAGEHARAVLVFPEILKAGFIVGAQQGDGTLFSHGRPIGYYKTVAASYGLQAGAQKFGYALFFMTDNDLAYLRKSGGWEIGTRAEPCHRRYRNGKIFHHDDAPQRSLRVCI